jgi:hypothetical protein
MGEQTFKRVIFAEGNVTTSAADLVATAGSTLLVRPKPA